MDPFLPEFLSPQLLPWELSILRIGLWCIGALTGVIFLLALFLRNSKKAIKILALVLLVPILFLAFLSWLFVVFDFASVVGWENGILAVVTFTVMTIIIWALTLKVLFLVEKDGHRRRLGVWALIFACVLIFCGSIWIIFDLLLKTPV